ncbi:unnamed protein product [Hymenolepis diminuta]|uniref:L-serine ammonia-lyase n=1 Tax=Hymenolepis diminuta TaxID=6216 RepID=A0A0R3SDS7_HYMDI|nr:unnamed protein product [Hymenolepis diminuta]VUZ39219.1 unnamed protein product [Hymenolepis diminuta]
MWVGNSSTSNGLFSSSNENNSQYGTFNGSNGLHLNSSHSAPNLVNNEDRSRTNLIINYLPQRFDQHDLHNLFEQIGPIRQCKLIRDRITGASLCYGFVDYMDPENAQKAINTFHGYEIEGKRLRVAYACSGGRRGAANSNRNGNKSPNENIIGWEFYIFGVPLATNDHDIMKNCREYGNVLQFKEISVQDISQILFPQSFCGIEISPDTHERLRTAAIQTNCKNIMLIYEEKRSCETLLQKLSGATNRDNTRVVCFIGNPVTREMGVMLINQSQGINSIPALRTNNVLSNTLTEGLASLNLGGPAASELKLPLRVQLPEISERSNTMSSQTSSFGARLHSGSGGGFFGENTQFSDPMSTYDQRCTRPEVLFPSSSVANDPFSRNFGDSPFYQGDLNIWSNGTSPLVTPDPRRLITPPQQSSYIITPVVKSASLTKAFRNSGGSGFVEMKLENLQPSGSVTMRVMDYAVKLIAEQNNKVNIVVPSTGNAAVSAAVAASHYKVCCTVVVPETDTHTKARLELEAPHSRLISFGSSFEQAAAKAEHIVATSNSSPPSFVNIPTVLLNIYSYVDAHIGYMSIIDELTTPPDVILLPLGGGILMCGVLNRLATRGWHSTHVVGVEPENIQRYSTSLNEFRQIPPTPGSTTVASGLNVGAPALKWLYVRVTTPTAASIVTVTESEIVATIRRLAEDCGFLLDPVTAVAAAAIYNGALARVQKQKQLPQNLKVLLLITGGRNISLKELAEMEANVVRNDSQHQQQAEQHDNDPTQNQQPFYLKTVDDLCNDDDDDEKGQMVGPITSSPKETILTENVKNADFESAIKVDDNKDENVEVNNLNEG